MESERPGKTLAKCVGSKLLREDRPGGWRAGFPKFDFDDRSLSPNSDFLPALFPVFPLNLSPANWGTSFSAEITGLTPRRRGAKIYFRCERTNWTLVETFGNKIGNDSENGVVNK